MDPQQRKLLEVVFECLENAGVSLQEASGSNTGCYVGNFTVDFQVMQPRGVGVVCVLPLVVTTVADWNGQYAPLLWYRSRYCHPGKSNQPCFQSFGAQLGSIHHVRADNNQH